MIANKELLLEHRLRGITVRELPSGRESKDFDLYRYLDYPDQVREQIEESMSNWDSLKARERRLWTELLLANIAPNLNFSSSATYELRREAAPPGGRGHPHLHQGRGDRPQMVGDRRAAGRTLREMAGRRDPGCSPSPCSAP